MSSWPNTASSFLSSESCLLLAGSRNYGVLCYCYACGAVLDFDAKKRRGR